LSGEQTEIVPVDGYFTVPSDGYVFVTGGNNTDTAIWMTWSDWTEEPNDGTWEVYSQTSIDLSGVMVNFEDGLMRIGNTYDEINLNTLKAYSRIQKLEYTEQNLAAIIALGVPYDTDTNYIYAVRQVPVTYDISLSGDYTVSDHGEEMFIGSSIPVTGTFLYGNDLKGKLRRDVLTISQQTLTEAQKAQVLTNIGGASASSVQSLSEQIATVPNKYVSGVDGNSSSSFTISNGAKIALFAFGNSASRMSIWNLFTNSSGSVTIGEMMNDGNIISITSTGNNSITITNSGNTTIYTMFLEFAGSITYNA
jgi:hypothetical protein